MPANRVSHGLAVNAVHFGQVPKGGPGFARHAAIPNSAFAEPSALVRLAKWTAAMTIFIAVVFLDRFPRQIVSAVVMAVAIIMCGLMLARRARPMKCQRNQSVDTDIFAPPINAKLRHVILPFFGGAHDLGQVFPVRVPRTDAPQIGRFVKRITGDAFPNFCGISRVAHDALLCVLGRPAMQLPSIAGQHHRRNAVMAQRISLC